MTYDRAVTIIPFDYEPNGQLQQTEMRKQTKDLYEDSKHSEKLTYIYFQIA